MSTTNKILLTTEILLGTIAIFSGNETITTLSILIVTIILITEKLTNHIIRKKLIKQIKNKNMTYTKVKENNILTILSTLLLIFIFVRNLESAFIISKIQNYDSIEDIIRYINSFGTYKWFILTYIILISIAIFTIAQLIFSSTIISEDKVIFYDDLVFDIDKIEEIKYKEPLISKNKKIITLGKGFLDRKIIVKIEEFDKIKNLLESKGAF